MKNAFNIAVVSVLAFIMSSCLNTAEKMEKVMDFYSLNGYDIKAIHGYEEVIVMKSTPQGYERISDNYILVEKNGTYYLDTEFKNKGKSAKKNISE